MNVDTLQKSQNIARGVLQGVQTDQLALSTPCESWTVGQLIDHMVGANLWATAAVKGEDMTDSGDGSSTGDYLATFDAVAEQCCDAFGEDGALDKMVDPGFGTMPATALLGMAITDVYVHAWDLATATGQDSNLDPAFGEQLLAASKASIKDDFRGPEGAPFGPEQPAPEGANSATKLAAFLGRKCE